MKNPLLSTRASLALLAAISFFYLFTGTLFYYEDYLLLGIALVIVGSLAALIFAALKTGAFPQEDAWGLGFIIVTGTVIRLILAYAYFGNYDMISWDIDANLGVRGFNVYAQTTRYDYAPPWFWILTFLKFIHLQIPAVPFPFIVRTFLTLADLLSLFFILGIAKIENRSRFKTALFFYLNPVSFLITGYHGQIENLALLMMVGGIFYFLKAQSEKIRSGCLWLFATAGLLAKHIILPDTTLLIKYAFRSWVGRFAGLALAAGVFLISFLPYWAEGHENIIHHVFLYKSAEMRYGITTLLNFKGMREFFMIAILLYPLLLKKKDLVQECLLGVLFFLTFTSGIGVQYFVLPIIFGALRPSSIFAFYSVIATIFIVGCPVYNCNVPFYFVRLLPFFGWNMVWAAVICWFAKEHLTRFKNSHA